MPNIDQKDTDNNGEGDACDQDIDGDGQYISCVSDINGKHHCETQLICLYWNMYDVVREYVAVVFNMKNILIIFLENNNSQVSFLTHHFLTILNGISIRNPV